MYGASGLICAIDDATATENYVLKDHLGSTRVAVNGVSGSIIAWHDYSAFGGVWRQSGMEPTNYLYTGQERDSELSLYNYRARMYDEDLMRFYDTDPAGQGFSPFAYAGNNPVMMVDPNGESFGEALGSIISTVNRVAISWGTSQLIGPFAGSLLVNVGYGEPLDFGGAGINTLSAIATAGIGNAFQGVPAGIAKEAGRAAAHGLAQGGLSALGGGNFGQGFLSGAFSSGVGSALSGLPDGVQIAGSAVAGGIGSSLGGGSFARGAISGATIATLNHLAHGATPTRPGSHIGETRSDGLGGMYIL